MGAGEEVPTTVDTDDSFRADCTLDTLGKLKPFFKKARVPVHNAAVFWRQQAAVWVPMRCTAMTLD